MLVEFSRILVPPVRLPERAALAREARRAPLFDHAARIAARLDPAGTPLAAAESAAARAIGAGPATPDGRERAGAAWDFGLAAGLITLAPQDGTADVLAVPGEVLGRLDALTADETLAVWRAGLDAVVAGDEEAGTPDDDGFRTPAPRWDGAAEQAYTDAILRVLYFVAVLESWQDTAPDAGPLTLPALAAILLTPASPGDDEDADPLDGIDDAELLAAVAALTDRLVPLAAAGLLDHTPGTPDNAYGTVRLTALGLLAVRDRLPAEGIAAPALGDLRDAPAAALLAVLPGYPAAAAHAEADAWLAIREPADAVAELLTAATADTAAALTPACLTALTRLGAAAAPALRAALADPGLRPLAEAALATAVPA